MKNKQETNKVMEGIVLVVGSIIAIPLLCSTVAIGVGCEVIDVIFGPSKRKEK